MRSRVGARSALKHEGHAQRRQRWGRGGYIQRRVEQINKASQEGAAPVQAGRELGRGGRQGSGGHS